MILNFIAYLYANILNGIMAADSCLLRFDSYMPT